MKTLSSRFLTRSILVALIAVAVYSGVQASIIQPVYATPFRFTTSSTQSNIEVIVSNPNPFYGYANLTLVLQQPNGVQRIWPAGRIWVTPGNSNHRVLVPGEIAGVLWARVTNVDFI